MKPSKVIDRKMERMVKIDIPMKRSCVMLFKGVWGVISKCTGQATGQLLQNLKILKPLALKCIWIEAAKTATLPLFSRPQCIASIHAGGSVGAWKSNPRGSNTLV